MLLLVSSAHVQTPPLVPRLPYDPLRDFTPIMQIAYYPLVLCVLPGFPAQTFAEFLAYQGTRVVANRPEEAAAFIRDEVAKWAEVVRAADIRAE
jgi:tripartite-type tricarboxylate transporter receptor subunit TctC